MKVALKFASKFKEWGNPELAEKISGILGVTDPTKRVQLTRNMITELEKLNLHNLSVFNSGSIKGLYAMAKAANGEIEGSHDILHRLAQLFDYMRKVEIGKAIEIKITDDKVLVLYKSKKKGITYTWGVVRSYKSKSTGFTSVAILTTSALQQLVMPHVTKDNARQMDSALYKQDNWVKTDNSKVFGSYDEFLFEGRKSHKALKKDGFPIKIADYKFSKLDQAFVQSAVKKEPFQYYSITGPGTNLSNFRSLDSDRLLCIYANGSKQFMSVVDKSMIDPRFSMTIINTGKHKNYAVTGMRSLPSDFLKTVYVYPIKVV